MREELGTHDHRDVEALPADYDLAIIGAGPAGLAAAAIAARLGLDTMLLDENAGARRTDLSRDHGDAGDGTRAAGRRLLARRGSWRRKPSRSARATCVPGRDGLDGVAAGTPLEIGVSIGRPLAHDRRRQVILATGALERPFPIPGWTLPGVMTAGARADRAEDVGPGAGRAHCDRRTGPLLWLHRRAISGRRRLASTAILDTTPRGELAGGAAASARRSSSRPISRRA